MNKTVYIFVPGILTVPGSAYNWCGRAVTWTHLHTQHKAEKVEYFTGPLSRPFGQSRRAHKLQRTLLFYNSWDIHVVAHSNGCDVVLDSLRSLHRDGGDFIRIKSLHFISAACCRDFKKNGLNLWRDKVGRTVIYIATKDRPLKVADTFFGRLFGYGTLGRHGSINEAAPVETVFRTWGHSDWFAPIRLENTMRMITSDHLSSPQ